MGMLWGFVGRERRTGRMIKECNVTRECIYKHIHFNLIVIVLKLKIKKASKRIWMKREREEMTKRKK